MAKKIILFLSLISFVFAIELDFKKTALDEFKIYGYSSKIIYKNKTDRDIQIARLWDRFLNSKDLKIGRNENKKIYVVYSNYKANSFDCFIGLKSKENILNSKEKTIPKSKYQKSILNYKKNMDMSTIWDDIQKKKLDRDFKADIEEYDLLDLQKESYFVNIYLSRK